jgi:hypothetical protein
LGIGDWAQSPIPNPQSPIPNPQSPLSLFSRYLLFYKNLKKFILYSNNYKIKINNIPLNIKFILQENK